MRVMPSARDLRGRRGGRPRPVRPCRDDRPRRDARDVRDTPDGVRRSGLSRRFMLCGEVRLNRHRNGRRGHARHQEIEPLARGLRLHEHVWNENGTGEYAGQHDRCEQAREDR